MKKNNDVNITIGKNIKLLRKNFNLTQEHIAKFLSISQENLSQIENGKRGLNITKLLKLCDLLGITLEYLLKPIDFKSIEKFSFSFRKNNVDEDLLKAIAYINEFSEEYLNLKRLLSENNK